MEHEIEVNDLARSGLEIKTLQVVRLLGKGVFGKVFLCEVTLSNGETKLLAVKQPKTTDGKMTGNDQTIESHAEHQRIAYGECVNAGVPTFKNYMVLDSGLTVADDLSEGGRLYCLGYSNGKKVRELVDEISTSNLEIALEAILECAETAGKVQILLPQDAYLFQLSVDESRQAEILPPLVGDFDLVGFVEDSSQEEVTIVNKKNAMSAVKFLISRMNLDNEAELNKVYAAKKTELSLV